MLGATQDLFPRFYYGSQEVHERILSFFFPVFREESYLGSPRPSSTKPRC